MTVSNAASLVGFIVLTPVSDASQAVQKRSGMWARGLDQGGVDPFQQLERNLALRVEMWALGGCKSQRVEDVTLGHFLQVGPLPKRVLAKQGAEYPFSAFRSATSHVSMTCTIRKA